jgi:hypothetical protein
VTTVPDDLLLGRRCQITDGLNRGRRGRVVRILEGSGSGINPASLVFALELDDPPGALVTADFRAIRLLPETSPAHRSRQMAKMNKAAALKLLKEHNIDATGMNWSQIMKIIQALLSVLGPLITPSAQTGGEGDFAAGDENHMECLKQHFETIQQCAACGIQCCECED